MIRPRRMRARPEDLASEAEVSFEQWVEPHWPVMRRLAERLVGPNYRDDVLQDALAAAWRSRSRFDPQRGTARTWLLAITANHAKKSLRSAGRRPIVVGDPDSATHEPSAAEDPAARVDLERAIRALPERQRVAVELCYLLGLPLADAAAVMDCAEGTVKSTLSAARARLRKELGEDYR